MKRGPYKLKPRTLCSIIGCGRIHEAHGWCSKHYKRFKAHGDPLKILRNEDGQGTIDRGYHRISVDGRRVYEHRYIMEQVLGRELQHHSIEAVHHKNEKPNDNRLENLEVLSRAKHMQVHKTKSIIIDGKKLCNNCRQLLPVESFHKESRLLSGIHGTCKTCANAQYRRYYHKST